MFGDIGRKNRTLVGCAGIYCDKKYRFEAVNIPKDIINKQSLDK